MIEQYIQRNGKTLKRGYTTGTCAAASAKAAASMLFTGERVHEVEVELPAGGTAVLKINKVRLSNAKAECCVVKDAGDDPDVTNKAEIWASVKMKKSGIELKGGEGIGMVTKRGLQVEVGEPAINPVPREMILREVSKVLPREGIEVTISVPNGRELAKRTMNQRLGIMEGISILGTTGIVEPRSEEALRDSLLPQIDVALALGYDEIVLTPGRIGEKSALSRGIPEDAIVQVSNFIGFMLQACVAREVKRALILGGLGKLTKVAGGAFYTHSKASERGFKTIASHVARMGACEEIIKDVLGANTTEEALEILKENHLAEVFDSIAEKVSSRAMTYVDNRIDISTALISLKGEVVGRHFTGATRWERYLS
ncbi:MAG: cobalt-precorrin-5B (C(1))-methyltransferase CbiD [Candidatus Hydrothermarchaeales archaeon]